MIKSLMCVIKWAPEMKVETFQDKHAVHVHEHAHTRKSDCIIRFPFVRSILVHMFLSLLANEFMSYVECNMAVRAAAAFDQICEVF